ncbi:hypothetical protein [Nostoc sp. FACHB-280]|uniref:hypothetical protein n=1 Tax=Nostoc sp. FACHB-280 TaxID=2692839 RepID=UPI00168A6F1B|nr:hypothetical protein [Nostoc sp. FACHB-280]MBD2496434.1 hypothetical protein [Nostoc sp. FACHB-280]
MLINQAKANNFNMVKVAINIFEIEKLIILVVDYVTSPAVNQHFSKSPKIKLYTRER